MINYTAVTVVQGTNDSKDPCSFMLSSGRTVVLTSKERKMTPAAAKQSVLKWFKKHGYNINGVKLAFVTTLDRLPDRN